MARGSKVTYSSRDLTIILTKETEKRLREHIAKKYPTEVYGKISQVIEEAVKEYLSRTR
jgi:hypothetical protein